MHDSPTRAYGRDSPLRLHVRSIRRHTLAAARAHGRDSPLAARPIRHIPCHSRNGKWRVPTLLPAETFAGDNLLLATIGELVDL